MNDKTTDNASKGIELPRTTKGKRPSFFNDPALDQMMTFILELTTEVAVLRERQDTVERLLDERGSVTRDDIERFRPDEEGETERVQWREEFLQRVLRLHPPQ